MEILIITGPPYSGKGTQCELLEAGLGFIHVSTGDRIRKEKVDNSPIGKIMTDYEERGDLVPDKIMKDLIEQIIDENIDKKGMILDGYPRTKPQVDTIFNLLAERKLKVTAVINIDVPREELLARAKKRAENSDRKDDQDINTHLKRIEVFESETRPAIEYMKSVFTVKSVDGIGKIEDITKAITEAVNAYR